MRPERSALTRTHGVRAELLDVAGTAGLIIAARRRKRLLAIGGVVLAADESARRIRDCHGRALMVEMRALSDTVGELYARTTPEK